MLLNEGELDGVRVLRAETVALRGPGWGFTLALGS
jgi:hypothetical protein